MKLRGVDGVDGEHVIRILAVKVNAVAILTSVNQTVVVLSVCSTSIISTLEFNGADTSRLAVGAVAHGRLAKRADGGGEKFL